MKLSLSRIILFTICLATTISIAMPTYYDINEDVEVRTEPLTETELEERFAIGAAASAVTDVVKMIIGVVGKIKAGIAQDKKLRGEFTSKLVGDMSKKNPHFNYIVCHTKHKTAFDGVQGKDWGHSHQEFDVKVGGTIGYEIYYLKSGTFTRKGDGGYLNWAYMGNVKSKSKNGKVITFAAPS